MRNGVIPVAFSKEISAGIYRIQQMFIGNLNKYFSFLEYELTIIQTSQCGNQSDKKSILPYLICIEEKLLETQVFRVFYGLL